MKVPVRQTLEERLANVREKLNQRKKQQPNHKSCALLSTENSLETAVDRNDWSNWSQWYDFSDW
jgi:hypothetical protein